MVSSAPGDTHDTLVRPPDSILEELWLATLCSAWKKSAVAETSGKLGRPMVQFVQHADDGVGTVEGQTTTTFDVGIETLLTGNLL